MGVQLPVYESKYLANKSSRNFTGLSNGGIQVSKSREMYISALESLVKLASLQTSFMVLDEVLKVSNRRVNAIEYIVIPRIEPLALLPLHLMKQREELFRLKKIKARKKIRNKEAANARVKWSQQNHVY